MLPQNRRRVIASALKAYANFIGRPELYQIFKRRYDIQYGSGQNSVLLELLNGSQGLNKIVEWLLEEVRPLGWKYFFPACFTVLTGLRASEGFKAIELAIKGLDGYYNPNLRCLEHFKFKFFLRRTKNAYLSFISENLRGLLEKTAETVSYPAFTSVLKRREGHLRFKEARRAWASELRRVIPSEAVDLLQGRIGPTVFVRHYYRPDLKELSEKVLSTLAPFEKRLFEEVPWDSSKSP